MLASQTIKRIEVVGATPLQQQPKYKLYLKRAYEGHLYAYYTDSFLIASNHSSRVPVYDVFIFF